MYSSNEYEYAQPVTYGASASVGTATQPIQLENPFNTDAEYCVEFYFANGTSGIVSISPDIFPSQNSATLGSSPIGQANGAIGYVFPVPLTSGFHSEYYAPVKQFLNLYANFTGAGFILIIGWRRPKEVYVPREHWSLNEPTA